MAQSPKTAWPKMAEGTTDWESVFETPDTGFIALVSRARTAEALKLGATVVIEKLFTREADTAERIRLIKQLDEIVAKDSADITAMIAGVTDLLRIIKAARIKKAETFIQRQKAGAAIDRRAGLLWKIDLLLKPAVLFPVGALFVAVLAGGMFWTLQLTSAPKIEGTPILTPRVEEQAILQQASADTGSEGKTKATKGEGEAKTKGEGEAKATTGEAKPKTKPESFPILLKVFRWPLLARSTNVVPQYYAVVPFVEKREELSAVCALLPQVIDKIYQSFNATIPVNRVAQKEELSQLQGSVKRSINAILSAPTIISVDVVRYGEKGFLVSTTPPYCKTTKGPSKEKTSKSKKE